MYRSFDEFLHFELGHEHDWWAKEKKRVAIQNLLMERGMVMKVPPNKALAAELGRVRDNAEAFVSVVTEFQELPETRQIATNLRVIVDRHLEHANSFHLLRRHVPDVTDDEVATLAPIRDRKAWPASWTPVIAAEVKERAEQLGQPLCDCLREVCRDTKTLPDEVTLLKHARGAGLVPLVNDLVQLRDNWVKEKHQEDKKHQVVSDAKALGLRVQDPAKGDEVEGCSDTKVPKPRAKKKSQAATLPVDSELSDAETQDLFRIELTGDAAALFQSSGYDHIGRDDLTDMLYTLADAIERGREIHGYLGITIRTVSDSTPTMKHIKE